MRSQLSQIWMYWETPPGRHKPPYLDLCLETVRRCSGGLILNVLDEMTIKDFLPNVRSDVSRLTLVHRSDYYRSRLVHQYGGIWLDADLIALRPLHELLEGWGGRDTALYGSSPSNLSANCFVADSGSQILEEWMGLQDRALDAGGPILWNDLGKHPLVAASRDHEYHLMPVDRIAPLPWRDWRTLLSRWRSPRRYLKADPIVFMLYNKFLSDALDGVSAEEILEGDMLISKLFRHALRED